MDTSEYLESLRKELIEAQPTETLGADALMEIAGNRGKLGLLIATLADSRVSNDARRQALNVIQSAAVFSAELPTLRPDYVNALRGLMNSDDPGLRLRAFSGLAVIKDDVAQSLLLDDLLSAKKEEDRVVPSHVAVALLGLDDKGLNAHLLHELAKNPPTEACLAEAVRHMPADDEESASILMNLLNDEAKPLEARRLVPAKLSAAHPTAFLSAVKRRLTEKGLEEDLIPQIASGLSAIDKEIGKTELSETKSLMRTMMRDASPAIREATQKFLKDDEWQ